jgi:UDP-N-acetylglucosamine 2-epimerase (non-hydrolysing)
MKVMCVAGARPNFMKVKPVLDALETRSIDTRLVHTGQHYDPEMSRVFFDDLGIRTPDFHLEVGSGSHAQQTAAVMTAFEPLVVSERPDIVVVVGDVNSTVACALVAAKTDALVAHVEAGLRSGDWSMPEEVNRVVTDRLSDFLFAPSPDAVDNLRAEGFRSEQIHLVGNVMIDTLFDSLERASARPVLADLGLEPQSYGLVTLHRPSNVDDPKTLNSLTDALVKVATELPLVFPLHPRTRQRLAASLPIEGVITTEPYGYLDFVALESQAALVLTDSGGVQEETSALGIPCLTLRTTTERPITVTMGTNRLVGTDRDSIVRAAREARGVDASRAAIEEWDGNAAERVASALVSGMSAARAARFRPRHDLRSDARAWSR